MPSSVLGVETVSRQRPHASALAFRIKPDSAPKLSVSFLDASHAGYMQQTSELAASAWQTLKLRFVSAY